MRVGVVSVHTSLLSRLLRRRLAREGQSLWAQGAQLHSACLRADESFSRAQLHCLTSRQHTLLSYPSTLHIALCTPVDHSRCPLWGSLTVQFSWTSSCSSCTEKGSSGVRALYSLKRTVLAQAFHGVCLSLPHMSCAEEEVYLALPPGEASSESTPASSPLSA